MSRKTIIAFAVICIVCLLIVALILLRGISPAQQRSGKDAYSELASALLEIESAALACLYANSGPSRAYQAAAVCIKSAEARIKLVHLSPAEEIEDLDQLLEAEQNFTQRLTKELAAGEELSEESAHHLKTYAETLSQISKTLSDGSVNINSQLLIVNNRQPKLLAGMGEISRTDAAAVAAKFTGLSRGAMKYTGEDELTYQFTGGFNGQISAAVTKLGGIMYSLHSAREPIPAGLTHDQAAEKAELLLRENGFYNMKITRHATCGGRVRIDFAYSDGGVTYYTDSIRVEIARDSGGIAEFSSRGFLENHHKRDLPDTKVKKAEAESRINPLLTPQSHKMAVIAGDLYCHEFKCTSESGKAFCVYINAESGVEEDIRHCTV
jgi:hypothetical protein